MYMVQLSMRSEERRVGKECQLVTGVQTCALPIYHAAIDQVTGELDSALPPGRRVGRMQWAHVHGPIEHEIGRASCRERVSIGDWSSDVCSSDLSRSH